MLTVDSRSRFVPGAERFAEALEADTAQAAVDVREHRNPDWGRVEEALHAWKDAAAGDRSPVVRRGAELQKRALEDLATAVSRTPLERDVGSAREEHGCGRPWRRRVTDQAPRTGVGDGVHVGEITWSLGRRTRVRSAVLRVWVPVSRQNQVPPFTDVVSADQE